VKRVYLDSNSAMPTRKEVIDEMMPYFSDHYGNASSIHDLGREPRRALENSREKVAALIDAEPIEIIFTSGATETINLALRGPMPFRDRHRDNITITSVDHQSVRSTSAAIEASGLSRTLLPVDELGTVIIPKARELINDKTYMLSLPLASYEVGTIQPVKELVEIAKENGSLVHIDLTNSAFQLPFSVKDIPADLITLSSNDLMGPKGVGALYVKKGTKISGLIKGGGHERSLRSGSENIPGIVGMGAAAKYSMDNMKEYAPQLMAMRDHLIEGLLKIPDSYLNGHPTQRSPNNANIRYDYIEGESMLLMLDMNGISVSSGSACSQKNLEPSKTLLAMGLKHEEAHGSLQFTFNPYNNMEDAQYVVSLMPEIVEQLREMSPLYNNR